MTLPAVIHDGDIFRATIGDEWLQGRTAYGGASAAIALAAAKMAHNDLPPLRSAQIAFVGPLSGAVVAEPVLLRRGKNSAFVGCDLIGADGVGLRALFLFMASRTSSIEYHELPAPDYPFDDVDLLSKDQIPAGFLENFDLAPWQRLDGTIRAWRRLKQRDALDPEVELVAIADALPPAAMSLAKEWGPISTTTWQLNLLTDTPRTHDGWWLLEAVTLAAHNGASSQTMTIWNREGEAVATATQSVALFI
jgi:Thioesterase-like superfamily